ncbi:glycosyltransferase family 2 protein [Marinomonas balearica]|uniref:GT2 family glycosyltransferase n=1 Tax=Marinomonas balearica TaxID=491947 RepID=A0A4R6M708_9GAMM|nr:glycosyl transferase [Marinomonas balearica]TDO97198.1 GT2 family glycosyltransferase [Marinomonas balearica]
MKNVIQNVIWPSLDLVAEAALYIRKNEFANVRLSEHLANIDKHGKLFFDTYFNVFQVECWKQNANLSDLTLTLKGKGKVCVRIELHRIGISHQILDEVDLILTPDGVDLPISCWDTLVDGLLSFSIEGLEEVEYYGGFYSTSTSKLQSVKVGLVITHFNRKSYVVPAIKRLSELLLANNSYRNKVTLTVIDNSQNLTDEEASLANVVKNPNLGGSGGFTRGLYELINLGGYTHCVFMDDDASCEVESIIRTVHILEYSTNPNMAISGALLRELEPYRLFEKGAKFNIGSYPLKSGLDMRSVHDLLVADQTFEKPDYGAWWYFAFPIEKIKHFAFPFFVRGDDIMFSLMNHFDIKTYLGISCWGDDFSLKDGPMPRYLDTRQNLVQNARLGTAMIPQLKLILRLFLGALFSYNYASAHSVTLAIKHYMKGPMFWRENMDMASVRNEVSNHPCQEKMQPLDPSDYDLLFGSVYEKRYQKWLRVISLNGFLLPKSFIRKRTVFQEKGFKAWVRMLYRYESVLYYYTPLKLGYVASHDKIQFAKELKAFTIVFLGLLRNFKTIQVQYQKEIPELTNYEFWKSVYTDQSTKKGASHDK